MPANFLKSIILSLLLISTCAAEEYRITPETDLDRLCEKVVAGDSIVLANGTWADAKLEFDRLSGTVDAPIRIQAETAGEVVFTGKSEVRVSGQHVIVSGLVFRDCGDVDDVFQLRSHVERTAQHCRVTDCVFEQISDANSNKESRWLSVYGTNHRIDHCYFAGKKSRGTILVVWVTEKPGKHQIDHNHFGPRPELGQNGGETIRVGTSDVSEFVSQTVVEDNYFHRCNGEAEVISNKSCENIYRYNLFDECAGALTLRHGHRCLVDGNVFLGNQEKGTGGVRIIGQGHHVINNYFEGLSGDKERAAISLMNGIPNSPLNKYAPVKDALVAHNTLVDCKVTMQFGVGASHKQSVAPANCRITNNIFSPGKWPLYRVDAEPTGLVCEGNKLQEGGKSDLQLVKVDRAGLRLERADDGLMRPADAKPIQSGVSTITEIKTDIDGEPRGEIAIAGCDEPGTPIRKFPSPADTGPAWWQTATN